MLEVIISEPNRYAEQVISSKGELPTHSRLRSWSPSDVSEMKAYLAMTIAMGLCRQASIQDYWLTHTGPLDLHRSCADTVSNCWHLSVIFLTMMVSY